MTKSAKLSKADRTLMRDLSKAKWKPWKRPKPGKEIVTPELMQNIYTTAHLAYGYMFLSREEMAKAIAKEIETGSKALSHLIGDCTTTHNELKALIKIVDGAQARLLAAGAALAEEKEAAS